MDLLKLKNLKIERRRKRNRAKIFGTAKKPRLSVFRSNKYTYAQLIDDFKGVTLVSASTRGLKKGSKISQAKALGELLAEKAKKSGIKAAVFNKGPYLFHGRVRAVAEGAKTAGLEI
jgi:large subunit ribosomal protein L18